MTTAEYRYVVVAKRLGADGNVAAVHAGVPSAGKIVRSSIHLKRDLIDAIGKGMVHYTAFVQNSVWQLGAQINIVSGPGGTDYVRTDPNQTLADNLEHLPDI